MVENEPGTPTTPDLPPPLEPKPSWKDRTRQIFGGARGKLSNSLGGSAWTRKLQDRLQDFDPAILGEWANRAFQKQGASFYGKLLTLVLCTFFLADVVALLVSRAIPEPRPTRLSSGGGQTRRTKTLEDYRVIFSRNIFNSQGLIPGDDTPAGGPQDPGGPATRTTLPFNLVGTLVLQDELHSIATIEDKSASTVYPVRVQDEIPSKAKILQIEPSRVIFLNVSSGRREYVELPEDANSTAPRITVGSRSSSGPGVEQVSPTQFNVSRTEVDRALSDMSNILTQARAVPNFENGVPNGYRLFQIVPGSIYAKLGLKDGDVIAGLNGQPINDPGKAFEMLNELKTASYLELQVKRDGKPSNFAYNIR